MGTGRALTKTAFILLLAEFVHLHDHNNCTYDNAIAPAYGVCSGPEERAHARRSSVEQVNHGCKIDEVFFMDQRTNELRCGSCLPNTTGNWRITGAPPNHLLQVEVCSITNYGEVRCGRPEITAISPKYYCDINEYCDSDGTCQSLLSSKYYGEQCNPTQQTGSNLCGGIAGLQCLGFRCVICTKNEPNTYGPRESALCLNGRYVVTKWQRFFAEPRSVLVAAFVLTNTLWLVFRSGIPQRVFRYILQRCRTR